MAAFQKQFPDQTVSTHTHTYVQNNNILYYSHYFSSMYTAHSKCTFCTELT